MTLEELRERCLDLADPRRWVGHPGSATTTAEVIRDAIRTIPLPAPVDADDEFAGHTPEPWTYDDDGWVRDGTATPIAQLDGSYASDGPDGRLIAAAPRLLRERDEWQEHHHVAVRERDEARDERNEKQRRNEGLHAENRQLRAEVAGLNAALAAAQKERDAAREMLVCKSPGDPAKPFHFCDDCGEWLK